MIAKEREILKAREIFDGMCQFIERASEEDCRVDQVERKLFRDALQLCLALLIAFVKGAGDGNQGKTLQRNGKQLQRLQKKRSRRYVSIFGEFSFKRYVYAVREGQKIEWVELDAQLGMPQGEFSYVVEDWQQKLVVKDAFGEAVQTLDDWLGVAPSVRSAEHMNRDMAQDVELFRDQQQQSPPPSDEEGDILVVTSDGKGVPMRRPLQQRIQELKANRPQDPRGRKPKKKPPKNPAVKQKRLGKGQKKTKKQMAYVGAVYTIDGHLRTADDILDEVHRRQSQTQRPRPQHKRVRAQMTQIHEGEVFPAKPRLFAELAVECEARDPQGKKPWICLMDGEKSLWDAQAEWFPDAVCILDLYHVLEYLWKAAHVFHKESSPEAQAFVDHYLRMLLEGKVGYVIGVFKRRLGSADLSSTKCKTLETVIGYYENNRARMRYDEYLAAGYPIGSGVAEGACRHLVKDRMEGTGMRWEIIGAQAMLDLRSIYLNDEWEDFLNFRIQSEQKTLYGQAA
ncbi:MAG: hypothetical protein CMJ50_08855 [Planctomycetaceae bacterium]|jgi:hypothetical protein|nr:hypothetical protein [Planctomycetaceae bacterium]